MADEGPVSLLGAENSHGGPGQGDRVRPERVDGTRSVGDRRTSASDGGDP